MAAQRRPGATTLVSQNGQGAKATVDLNTGVRRAGKQLLADSYLTVMQKLLETITQDKDLLARVAAIKEYLNRYEGKVPNPIQIDKREQKQVEVLIRQVAAPRLAQPLALSARAEVVEAEVVSLAE